MDIAKQRAIAAQHAETARLLGVDFVPMYRSNRTDHAAGASPLAPTQPDNAVPATSFNPASPGHGPSQSTSPDLIEPKSAPVPAAPAPAAPKPVASPSSNPTAAEPRDRAAAQRELDDIRARYEKDAPHKSFVSTFTNIVFGEGDPCARLMFIGEAPGEEEDKTGRPFVGRAGKLLTDMIIAMGLTRESVYIANVLKTRPPNNATPTGDECRLCKPYLFEQVAAIRPEVIVTLGLPASRTVLDSTDAMGKLRGKWASFRDPRGRTVPVMPTYHPAYLLRNYTPEERRKVWSDLKMVMERLGLGGPSAGP